VQQRRYFLDGQQAPCVLSFRGYGPARRIPEWRLECTAYSGCIARGCFLSTLSFFRLCIRRSANCDAQAMYSWRVWVLAQIELEIARGHARLKVSTSDSSPLDSSFVSEAGFEQVCWPSQRLNSASRLNRSFSASATT